MNVTARPYRDNADLMRIGALIRRAYAQNPLWNSWTFARYDIWAQRCIANERLLDRDEWCQDIRLWEWGDGTLGGAVFFEKPHEAALISSPDHRELYEPMLAWAEHHYSRRFSTPDPLQIEVMGHNSFQRRLVQSQGYTPPEHYFIHREKRIDGTSDERALLPPGFVLRQLDMLQDLAHHITAVKAVFNFQDSVEAYRYVQQAPSYVPGLDLIVLAPEKVVAAFCTVWLDTANTIAEFEPVGTVPAYRRRGLGRALLTEAGNRLRALGYARALVNAWGPAEPANAFYSAVGLHPKDTIYAWCKP